MLVSCLVLYKQHSLLLCILAIFRVEFFLVAIIRDSLSLFKYLHRSWSMALLFSFVCEVVSDFVIFFSVFSNSTFVSSLTFHDEYLIILPFVVFKSFDSRYHHRWLHMFSFSLFTFHINVNVNAKGFLYSYSFLRSLV